jgi:WD40 repeat protein
MAKLILWILCCALVWCGVAVGESTPQLVPQFSLNMDDESDITLAWSPDGRFLSIGRGGGIGNGQFRVLTREGAVWGISDGLPSIRDCDWAPDSARLALTQQDGVSIVDVASMKVTSSLPFMPTENGRAARVVKWLPSGDELIVVTSDGVPNEFINGEVQAWRLTSGARRTLAKFKQQLWNDVVVSPDGKTIAIATDGVRLIDAVKGGQLLTLNTELREIKLAWSPDGRVLAARGISTGVAVTRFSASMLPAAKF